MSEQKQQPAQTTMVVLWAACEQFGPQVVRGWSASYWETYPEGAQVEREEAEDWYRNFGDPEEPYEWTFWTRWERVYVPTRVPAEASGADE